MTEFLDESPVRINHKSDKWVHFKAELECPCPACPVRTHSVAVKKVKGYGKMMRVKGMLQSLRDVHITLQDSILYSLDVAEAQLEEQIRKELERNER